MSKKITDVEVDVIENDLRKIEGELEKIGQNVCDVEGGALSWNEINEAISRVQDAIRECWRMRPED